MALLAIPLVNAFALLLEQVLAARLHSSADPIDAPRWAERFKAWAREVHAAGRVFYWEQPWRFNAWPHLTLSTQQSNVAGVLLVHGFLCNRGFWNPWRRPLRDSGYPSHAITLAPAFAPIERHAEKIEAAFQDLLRLTGRPPVVVAHSMGGLAVRAWLAGRAEHQTAPPAVITIGTPHQGTWLARWSHRANGRQMRIGSPWLTTLRQVEAQRGPPAFPWVNFYSRCDNVVFPPRCAMLPEAQNRHLPGQPHIQMVWHPEVLATVLRLASSSAVQGSA